VIDKPIVVRSVNGPDVTRIEGGAQTRCVYVGTNAVLEGFWLQFGNTRSVGDRAREQSGGGAWGATSGRMRCGWCDRRQCNGSGWVSVLQKQEDE